MLISVVIPVYNAEKYLERCVESVMASLAKMDGEVLLIDNNSTDESANIANALQKEYPKMISVLHCNTPGASAVRNFGAKRARGDYLWFIDADDTITPDAITKLVRVAEETKADIVMMGAKRVYADGHSDYLSAVEASKPDYRSRFVRYGAGPWQFLFRTSWWKEHDFRFREGMIHEDMEMISSLILFTDKFASVDEPLYFYYQNVDSVLHKCCWDEHAFDIFPALEGLYKRFEKMGMAEKYHDELEWFFIWNLLIDSAKDFAKFPEGKPGFARSREMLTKYFPGWRKNRFLKQKPLRLKIRVGINYNKR